MDTIPKFWQVCNFLFSYHAVDVEFHNLVGFWGFVLWENFQGVCLGKI